MAAIPSEAAAERVTHHVFRRVFRGDHGPILASDGRVLEWISQLIARSLQPQRDVRILGWVVDHNDVIAFTYASHSVSGQSCDGEEAGVDGSS